ncbi:RNase J family beta-CASP ribonuclease [Candidatus Woesearchaeota archaeon]|nr:RNase J family beta-CASP ribonuclease [Candidatus Woesearchaeota archaeon]
MGVEIYAVGGYNEVGKNMTAVKVDDEVIIFDMGLHLPNYIRLTEEEGEDVLFVSADDLKHANAIPNDDLIADLRKRVKAIIPTHAHLDHIGAVPYLADKYNAPILATPYTCAVLKAILKDEKIKIKNQIKTLSPNSVHKISENITVEFVNVTHSTPQVVMVALHTKYGVVLYANDFKFDNHPVLGKKPNYDALKRLGKKGILVMIVDSLYGYSASKTPSENVAREMLRDVMLGVDSKGKAVIVTTFSSHLARLKSIIEFGKQMNRKVILLGRSLRKYVGAGEEINLVNFSKDAEIAGYSKQIKKKLKQIQAKGVHKYLLVVTGHQGEPKSTLSKMVKGAFDFKFKPEDHVIFSCAIIPNEINKANRAELESKLKHLGVRIFSDIHVSGHAAREDLRDFVNLTKPKNIIPAHAEKPGVDGMIELCQEMGYKKEKNVFFVKNGQRIKIK